MSDWLSPNPPRIADPLSISEKKRKQMNIKKLNKLVGLKEEDFKYFIGTSQIQYTNARLIPLLKTGDEMALTSIFLSSVRLVKEFRNLIFKHIKLPKSGKFYYLTEVSFPELSKSRIDGLIVVIKSSKITNAVIFEMKKESNQIEKKQLDEYITLAQKLKIENVVTISNQYVSEPTESPVDIRIPKKINLFHFSWTYLLTLGRILLYKNDNNIEDEDQVEVMKEVYFTLKAKSQE